MVRASSKIPLMVYFRMLVVRNRVLKNIIYYYILHIINKNRVKLIKNTTVQAGGYCKMVVEDSGGKEGTLERKRKMTPQIVRVSINRLRGSTKKKRREENRESIVS